MRISVLALDGVFDTGLAVILDVFSAANGLSAQLMGGALHFHVSLVGVRRRVRSGQGFQVPVKAISSGLKPEWVIVPALPPKGPEEVVRTLQRPDILDARAQLLEWHAKGAHIAASCAGTFILAETGLLDHQEATTNWALAPLFRQRYPNVSLDETRMVVSSGRVVTTGAALGHLDLALWLIRRVSPELSDIVSRYLVADLRTSQAPYVIPTHLAQADPLVQRFERWAREHLKHGFDLQAAAKALTITPRTLQRRCNEVLGKSPLSYFQDLRVERARSLVHGGRHDIEAIAAEVGYDDGATLRTLLRQRLGRGVRELRADAR